MGKRNTGRKLAMQALYQADIRKKNVNEFLPFFLDADRFSDESKEWANFLATNTWAKLQSLDEIIVKYSVDWDLNRIHPIDKALLRLALFELQYADTPSSVVLNEIIEIAKRYSTEDSAKFINGILGNFLKNECSQV